MNTEDLAKALEKYPGLERLDLLVAGITIGMSGVGPMIIFRFVAEAIAILDYSQKQTFHNFLLQTNLGKAREILINTKPKPKKSLHRAYPKQEIYSCKLCGEPVQESELEYPEECADIFHRACILKHLEGQIKQSVFPLACPQCKTNFTQKDLNLRLPEPLLEKYDRLGVLSAVGDNLPMLECPSPTCKHVIALSKGNIDKIECPKCRTKFCKTCHAVIRHNGACEQCKKPQFVKCPSCHESVGVKNSTDLLCKCYFQFCSMCLKPPTTCKCSKLLV